VRWRISSGVGAVVASLALLSSAPAGAHVERFADVRGDEPYGPAVAWLLAEGVVHGADRAGDRFRPRDHVSRSQLVALVWRAAGRPDGYPPHGFADVPPDAHYDPALRWLRAEGHVHGVAPDRFHPTGTMTRGEVVTLLWRLHGSGQEHPPHGFVDVPPELDLPVRWARVEGVAAGVSAQRFAPERLVTRGQVATLLWRTEGRPAPPDPGPAVTCTSFATQPEAQGWFDLHRPHHGDVAGLDPQRDGVACPHLPGDRLFPVMQPEEIRRLQLVLEPLPGTHALDGPPPIYGHGEADARIRALAERRGYRLQALPAMPLAAVDGVAMLPPSADALRWLLGEARRLGMQVGTTSGHRSVDQQRAIFQRRLAEVGRARIGRTYTMGEIAAGAADGAIEAVLRFSSIPGYSKHHTGRTVDLHAGGSLGQFEHSPVERWLRAYGFFNAFRFGFVPSYPQGATAQGPDPEPWEYVHVGTEPIRCAAWLLPLADPLARSACPAGPPARW
jgi:hypothetical protein